MRTFEIRYKCWSADRNEDGKYNILLVGTRKDKDAVAAWKGAERLKK